MNRYAARGLIAAAAEGQHIIVLTVHQVAARDAFTEVTDAASKDDGIRGTTRSKGRERIDFEAGGSIYFSSHRGGLRGKAADVVYLDAGVDQALDHRGREDVRAVIAGSPHGEIIRA